MMCRSRNSPSGCVLLLAALRLHRPRSVTISVADIDLVQLDLTIVLTAIETARANERRRRESAESGS